MRAVTRHILQRYGYAVLEASDGEQGLRICSQHRGPIHLLLTDVVMPGIGGRQLAEQLGRLRPETKVLFVSGYTDDILVRHGVAKEQVDFLQKPFLPSALIQKIRSNLARR